MINALNRDLPYDRFIIEQIAGDLLPGATQDQVVATGFLRNSMVNEEGGVDPEQFRMEAMFDRVEAIGKGILGLTVQCAQCHSHKFDPISHEEYYRLFAFLNNDDEPTRVVYTPEERRKVADVRRQVREVEDAVRHSNPDWRERMDRWEDDRDKATKPKWTVIQAPFEDISTGGEKYLLLPDGSFRAAGYAPTKHTGKFTVKSDLPRIAAFKIELMNDANLPAYGPGRSLWGTCALTEFKVEAGSKDRKALKFAKASADFEQSETPLEAYYDDKSGKKRVVGPVSYAIDGKDDTAWGIDAGPGRRNNGHEAVFVAEKPIENPEGTELTFGLMQNHGGWNSDDLMTNNIGRFRLSVTDAPDAQADPAPRPGPRGPGRPPRPSISRAGRDHLRLLADHRPRVEGRERPDRGPMEDPPRRGDHAGPPGEGRAEVDRHPQAGRLPQARQARRPRRPRVPPPAPGRRAAEPADVREVAGRPAVADHRKRSFVNRAWQAYFGTGLLATSEDFGMQAEAPSHPELLDWLACEFMDRGWGIKDLHRMIVTLGRLPAVEQGDARGPREGPVQPAPGPGVAAPGRGGGRPGHPARGQRPAEPQARRPERDAAGPRLPVPAPGQLRPVPLGRGQGPRPLPTGRLHPPEAFDALSAPLHLRRARGQHLVRPPGPLELAAPGPHHPERDDRRRGRPRPRPEARAGRRGDRLPGRRSRDLCFPPMCVGRAPTDSGAVRPAQAPRRPAPAVRRGLVQPLGDRHRQQGRPTGRPPQGLQPDPVGRLYRRRPGVAEPRRDDHQGIGPRRVVPAGSEAHQSEWCGLKLRSAPPYTDPERSIQDNLMMGARPVDRFEHARDEARKQLTRRWFFRECAASAWGPVALGSLMGNGTAGAASPESVDPLAPKAPHFPGKAKRVIFLFQAGAPSHLDLFDDKPQLRKFDGTLPPPELLKDYRAAFINPSSTLLAPKFKFNKYGQSGSPSYPNCSPTWARWWTTWPSSNRWSPTLSIMPRPRSS